MSTSHPSLSFPHSHIIYWKGNFLAVEQGVNKDQMLPSLMKERGFLYQLWYVPVKKKKPIGVDVTVKFLYLAGEKSIFDLQGNLLMENPWKRFLATGD